MTKTTLSRREALDQLRERLLALGDDDHSVCEVAARRGIFCKGFSQWSFEELKQRYDWIVARQPGLTRSELESRANAWQLARQQVLETPTPCDSQEQEHDTCRGWDEFTGAQIAGFLRELGGPEVLVEDEKGV